MLIYDADDDDLHDDGHDDHSDEDGNDEEDDDGDGDEAISLSPPFKLGLIDFRRKCSNLLIIFTSFPPSLSLALNLLSN